MTTPAETGDAIVFVRDAPGSQRGRQALSLARDVLAQCTGEVVVFFHGDGVEQAARSTAEGWQALARKQRRLVLEVCSAAWQRRRDDQPPAPFVASSLIRFWHRLAGGHAIDGRQAGPAHAHWLVRVERSPDQQQCSELLELVMAGASLELPVVVMFRGKGCGHLQSPWAERWRQLIDFDLARLVADCAATPAAGELSSDRPDADELERLVATARGVLQS